MNLDEPRPTLTDAGRAWCERNCWTSMMANVALFGSRGESSWPESHIRAAIIVANEEGQSPGHKHPMDDAESYCADPYPLG